MVAVRKHRATPWVNRPKNFQALKGRQKIPTLVVGTAFRLSFGVRKKNDQKTFLQKPFRVTSADVRNKTGTF
ncbi:MAG: hypothetical protein DME22_08900 [Verrucomicrobia bacterium]|nr:MAG: hypothetical protein DME22_08900 [Verrucomicrobiota bacterium]PYJ99065.1 MAG: hypothetical protein DME23_10545 [Verrucomicrobiota bacterium]